MSERKKRWKPGSDFLSSAAAIWMVPLLALGIPSSPTIAVLMGAFIVNGITPGPFLFKEQPALVWTVIASFFVGNALLLILNLPLVGKLTPAAGAPARQAHEAVDLRRQTEPFNLDIEVAGARYGGGLGWYQGVIVNRIAAARCEQQCQSDRQWFER